MNVVVGTDLLIRSRIAAAVDRARANWSRVDEPIDLPPPHSVDLVFVDWGNGAPGWTDALQAWSR